MNEKLTVQLRAEFFDILNHANFVVGHQVYLMGAANTVTPTNAGRTIRNFPIRLPMHSRRAGNPLGGVLLQPINREPGHDIHAETRRPVAGPCYTSGTGLGATTPGD